MNLRILVVQGNTYQFKDVLDEMGLEYDQQMKWYAMYLHPDNSDAITRIVNMGLSCKTISQAEWDNRLKAEPAGAEHPLTGALLTSSITHEFITSLKEQYKRTGRLSDKQWAAAEKWLKNEKPKNEPKVEAAPIYRHPLVGQILELTKRGALIVSENLGTDLAIRQVEVLEFFRETEFRYSAKVTGRCKCCGLKLTHPISVVCGIGPECAEKLGIPRSDYKSAEIVIKTMEARFQAAGECTSWIPKSVIKATAKE